MILKNHLKRGMPSLSSFAFVLVWFAIAALVRAVVPAPDGSYPSFNTAEGQNALFNLTTGVGNTAVGWFSLWSDSDGSYNTALGAGTLLFNTGNQSTGDGKQNTAVATAALFSDTVGFSNIANGVLALFTNTEGSSNTAVGNSALSSNTIGNSNTAVGPFALFSSSGAIDRNTAVGAEALFSDTGGHENTAIGTAALHENTNGSHNVAVGNSALSTNTSATGVTALTSNTTGDNNTAIGFSGLFNNATGFENIGLSRAAGQNVITADHVIAIGANGQNLSNSCFIGQIYTNIQPEVGTDPDLVTINSNGRLGRSNVSSRRYKHDIQPMHKASEAIYTLNPVSFRYHKQYDQTQTIAFGLIPEEVAEVNPDLVGRDLEGQPESVRYEQINAMLLNEFLKEQRRGDEQDCKIQKQETTISELRSEIRSLAAMVNDQASEWRNVSAQLQISNAGAQEIAINRP